jgi:wobble nucleotide-excising tRNase
MLTDLKQTIEQRDSKIARLQQMILEKRQSAIGYRDFIVLKNSQEELRELCKKIDLQMVKTNELLRHIRNTKVIFSDLLLLEAEVNEQMSKIQELSNAFFIQEEAGK